MNWADAEGEATDGAAKEGIRTVEAKHCYADTSLRVDLTWVNLDLPSFRVITAPRDLQTPRLSLSLFLPHPSPFLSQTGRSCSVQQVRETGIEVTFVNAGPN